MFERVDSGSGRRGSNEAHNSAVERTAGLPSLAAAAHRERLDAKEPS
jgi:hypothetical protein